MPSDIARQKTTLAYKTGKLKHKNPIILITSEIPCRTSTE